LDSERGFGKEKVVCTFCSTERGFGKEKVVCTFCSTERGFGKRKLCARFVPLKEDLGKRKLCARFVPHSLTPEQREDRVTPSQDNIVMADADKNFLNKIITGDET
jgi:hypothetical protein